MLCSNVLSIKPIYLWNIIHKYVGVQAKKVNNSRVCVMYILYLSYLQNSILAKGVETLEDIGDLYLLSRGQDGGDGGGQLGQVPAHHLE